MTRRVVKNSTSSSAVTPGEKPRAAWSTIAIAVGNTSLIGAVFSGERQGLTFRIPATDLFKLARLAPRQIDRAVICSVVPALTPDVTRFIKRTWELEPVVLTSKAPHGLKIGYRKPAELGTDRIAAALGARAAYPDRDVIVVDCGTATTVTAVRRDNTILGGAILPGLSMWPEILALRTAQLPRIEPQRPPRALGRSTTDGIASGIFFGHLGALREVIGRIRMEVFPRSCVVIGTGGHADKFAGEKLFTTIEPDLILRGLHVFAERSFRP